MTVYTGALTEFLGAASGSAAATAIGKLIDGKAEDPAAGVVERAELEDERKGRIKFVVAGVVALALALALFRRRGA